MNYEGPINVAISSFQDKRDGYFFFLAVFLAVFLADFLVSLGAGFLVAI
jgi:hypothetical protein